MFHFKWTPPGRGLWIAGTPLVYDQRNSAALQNPLHEDTRVFTRDGWRRLGDLEGQTVELLSSTHLHGRDPSSKAGGTSVWVKGEVSNIEIQPSIEIDFVDVMGNARTIIASRNHRWFVASGGGRRAWSRVDGNQLKVGDYLPTIKPRCNFLPSVSGMQHGFFFGDGSRTTGEFEQFGSSTAVLARLFGDQVKYRNRRAWVGQCPLAWGFLPEGRYLDDQRYVYGFLAGYFAADGCVSKDGSMSISSARRGELSKVADLFDNMGIEVSPIRLVSVKSNYAESRVLYSIRINRFDVTEDFFLKLEHRERWLATTYGKDRCKTRVKVTAIRDAGEQRVLCATVPHYEQFVTEGYVLTSNCGFVSTNDMTKMDPAAPFKWFMEALMLGVGIGFDDKGADKDFVIYEPTDEVRTYVIPDTREGWVESLGLLLETFLLPDRPRIEFDYSEIRPAGTPIKTFGGTAAGHKPLQRLHRMVIKKFSGRSGGKLSRIDIADIGNQIGLCVVAGNVRRSAELLIGHIDDKDFINLKNYEAFPERNFWTSEESDERGWGWMCVPSDTWIMTESGPLKVQDLVGVDFKTTLSGELHAASGFWQTAKSRQVYQVTTRAGYQLEATDNHPVMTKRGWVRVDELTTSDHVLIAHHPGHKWEGNGGSFAEGYLLGAVWSDGWISGNRAHIALYGREFDLEWARYIEGCARTVGAQGGFQRPTTRGEHRLASKALKHFTDRFGFTADRKALSESIERMSSDFYCGFLSAALDGDGTIAQYRQDCDGVQVILSQSSLEDLRGIQRMLGRLGIYSTIRTGKVTGFPSRMPHSLALAARSLSATTSRLALKNPLKAERLHGASAKRAVGQPYWAQVASIIPSRCAAVYDVTIQDVHCFDANGIVVHNSNNSVKAQVGDSYSHLIDGIRLNGEPGIIWMDLSRQYGRLIDPPDNRDWRVQGYNPCAEQSLESYEMCTLVETYLNRHESLEDFQRTLKYAFMYAKTVTLVPTHWERTNAIMQRNRRIGCSVSGVANFADNRGLPELRTWLNKGYETVKRYDYVYSEWLCVRESIKMTTVKPSGTVSILAGESPGVHWAPGGAYFNRAVRLAKDSSLVPLLQQAGYTVEPDVKDPDTTMVAYFPIHTDAKRAEGDVTVFEKANLAVVAQRYWSDNSVSVTLSFNAEEEAEHIGTVLHMHEGQLKTVSFLPMGNTVYPQQPYTKISEHQYQQASQGLKKIDLGPIYDGEDNTDAVGELYCTTDSCEIKDHKLNSGS